MRRVLLSHQILARIARIQVLRERVAEFRRRFYFPTGLRREAHAAARSYSIAVISGVLLATARPSAG